MSVIVASYLPAYCLESEKLYCVLPFRIPRKTKSGTGNGFSSSSSAAERSQFLPARATVLAEAAIERVDDVAGLVFVTVERSEDAEDPSAAGSSWRVASGLAGSDVEVRVLWFPAESTVKRVRNSASENTSVCFRGRQDRLTYGAFELCESCCFVPTNPIRHAGVQCRKQIASLRCSSVSTHDARQDEQADRG